MPHKEERFLLPIIPAISILSGFFLNQIKKYKKALTVLVILILILSNTFLFYITYKKSNNETNDCFLKANKFLEDINRDISIITEQSPLVYYYTKKETKFYSNYLDNNKYKFTRTNKDTYVFFTDFDMPPTIQKNKLLKEELDTSFETVFNCLNKSLIYKIN